MTPQTTSKSPSNNSRFDPLGKPTPRTPSHSITESSPSVSTTPTTARRAALYERIRQKCLTSGSGPGTPIANTNSDDATLTPSPSNSFSVKDKFRQLSQEAARRRLLLGRLEQVAATVWACVILIPILSSVSR
ncbi:MAG TPA: hypothetical protein VGO47_11115 [Chlamydiales bacterium]|nr:hypothetical protein [Chlamydiales bacterium]